MKKIYLVILVLLAAVTTKAQAPQKFSYQAVIRNNSNALITNQAVSERISLVKDSASGTVVYSEKQNVKTNANGLVSLQIGTGSVVSGSFSSINWGAGDYFIKIETDPTGGNNYTINTTTQLLSVPYALYAANGGTPGPQGIQGPKGDSGARGLQGIQGIQGLKGDKGDQGIQGIQGLTGSAGAKGDSGARGLQGIQGIQGLKGDKGDQGIQGIQGLTGATGAKGDSGARGLQGIQGIQGLKGDKGDQGIQGIQGLPGATGAKGDSGARGLQGIQGIQGVKGATGAKGDSGVSVRSTIVVGDSLFVTLSTGQKVNAGNVRGLKGVAGQNAYGTPNDGGVVKNIFTSATVVKVPEDKVWKINYMQSLTGDLTYAGKDTSNLISIVGVNSIDIWFPRDLWFASNDIFQSKKTVYQNNLATYPISNNGIIVTEYPASQIKIKTFYDSIPYNGSDKIIQVPNGKTWKLNYYSSKYNFGGFYPNLFFGPDLSQLIGWVPTNASLGNLVSSGQLIVTSNNFIKLHNASTLQYASTFYYFLSFTEY